MTTQHKIHSGIILLIQTKGVNRSLYLRSLQLNPHWHPCWLASFIRHEILEYCLFSSLSYVHWLRHFALFVVSVCTLLVFRLQRSLAAYLQLLYCKIVLFTLWNFYFVVHYFYYFILAHLIFSAKMWEYCEIQGLLLHYGLHETWQSFKNDRRSFFFTSWDNSASLAQWFINRKAAYTCKFDFYVWTYILGIYLFRVWVLWYHSRYS